MGEGWVFSSISSRLHPHLHVLRDIGVSVERELEHDGLPASFEERPDIRTATRLIGKFVARMEHNEGIDDLCYFGARNDVLKNSSPNLISFLFSTRTLKESLDRLAIAINSISGRDAKLHVEKGSATFVMDSPLSEPTSAHQRYSDWSTIHGFLLLMRTALGPLWCPDLIMLQARYQIPEAVLADLPHTRVYSGKKHTLVKFASSLLTNNIPKQNIVCHGSAQFSVPCGLHGTVPEMLGHILQPYLTSSKLSVELAAEAVGMSVRSLQRLLAAHGLSYSALIDGERSMLALELLRNPEIRITDIAFDLGYNNPTHFSRAFRRLTGQSPRKFRQDSITHHRRH